METLPGAERISGSNRNDTNAKVIEKFYPNASLNNLYIAKNMSVITRVGGNGNENTFEEIKVLKGMKPAELKLPNEMLCSWFIRAKEPGTKYYNYRKFFEI